MVLMKPKDFEIDFRNDQHSPNTLIKQEEEKIDTISQTYVIC